MPLVKVDKDDLTELLAYLELQNEEKDYHESAKPKNHIWLVIKSIMKQVGYQYTEQYNE